MGTQARPERPDILWLTMDHVTYAQYRSGLAGAFRLGTHARLAGLGAEFASARSVHPLCLPCRASMLTGVYPHKHRKTRNEGYISRDPEYPTIGGYMREAGYRTGYFGKNHSGFGLEGEFEGMCGDENYGMPYWTERYKGYLSELGLPHPIYRQEWGIMGHPDGEYDLTESGNFNTYSAGVMLGDERAHESRFLLHMAGEWLRGRKAGDGPSFLKVDFWGPHHAFTVPEPYAAPYGSMEVKEYPSFGVEAAGKPGFVAAFARRVSGANGARGNRGWEGFAPIMQRAFEHYSFIDDAIGRFLDGLDGMGDTVVILTADHGDALGSHGGFVDKAGDLMEEVMRIPMVICAPGVKGGLVSDALVSNMDLTPTVLDFAGVGVPGHIDGRSLLPILYGVIRDGRAGTA